VEKNLVNAIKCYEKSAENGNCNAQYSLGDCYLNGVGVIKDGGKAFKWYKKSAEKEDTSMA
jgi:TPR repeat protein